MHPYYCSLCVQVCVFFRCRYFCFFLYLITRCISLLCKDIPHYFKPDMKFWFLYCLVFGWLYDFVFFFCFVVLDRYCSLSSSLHAYRSFIFNPQFWWVLSLSVVLDRHVCYLQQTYCPFASFVAFILSSN